MWNETFRSKTEYLSGKSEFTIQKRLYVKTTSTFITAVACCY